MRISVIASLLSAGSLLTACSEAASDAGEASGMEETTDPSPILAELETPWSEADVENGRRIYRQCQSCHTLSEGGRNMVGPNLYGLFGREAGSVDSFRYSPALQNADFVWTPETLDQWLANPREFLPGNRMSYAGLRDETQRRDVIGYIAVETASE